MSDFHDSLNRVLKYGDKENLLREMATDKAHREPKSTLRLIAADAHQEAGDQEFADYLRSDHPLAVDEGKVLRTSFKLHRLLHTLHHRNTAYRFDSPEEQGTARLNDPLNKEAVAELTKLGREHEASILQTGHPTQYSGGLVRGDYDRWAGHGGYPFLYRTRNGNLLCPECRNGGNGSLSMTADPDYPDDHQWYVNGANGALAHWEGPPIHCDHCNKAVESAYGDPDAEEETE